MCPHQYIAQNIPSECLGKRPQVIYALDFSDDYFVFWRIYSLAVRVLNLKLNQLCSFRE